MIYIKSKVKYNNKKNTYRIVILTITDQALGSSPLNRFLPKSLAEKNSQKKLEERELLIHTKYANCQEIPKQ